MCAPAAACSAHSSAIKQGLAMLLPEVLVQRAEAQIWNLSHNICETEMKEKGEKPSRLHSPCFDLIVSVPVHGNV